MSRSRQPGDGERIDRQVSASGDHAPSGPGELVCSFEPLAPDEEPRCYFYPREATDRELEAQWITATTRCVVDLLDAR